MIMELIVASDMAAIVIGDTALAYGLFKDYMLEKRSGKVGSFREYFSRDARRLGLA